MKDLNTTTKHLEVTMSNNLTPQEEAKELFDKFYFINSESVELVTGEHELLFSLSPSDAKECAIIHLEKLIELIDHTPLADEDYAEYLIKRLQQVRQEIEKL